MAGNNRSFSSYPLPVPGSDPIPMPPPGYPDLRPQSPSQIPSAPPGSDANTESEKIAAYSPPQTQETEGPRRYIRNRVSNYNPFASENKQSITSNYDPNDSEPDMPTTSNYDSSHYAQKYEADQEEPVKQQKKATKGNGCGPLGILTAILKTIWGFLKLIRNLIFTTLILSILAILALLLTIIYKPPLFWNPLKTFLNAELVLSVPAEIKSEDIYARINDQALNDQPVTLNEQEVTQLFREYNYLGEKCFVRLHEEGMKFFINVDTAERPLWMVVDTNTNKNTKLTIANVGFGRFNAPGMLNGIFNDTLGQAFNFLEKQVTADTSVAAMTLVLDTSKIDKDLTLSRVEFGRGNVVLSYQNNSAPDPEFN